ncbi:hypothetical protein GCM10029963_61610 [Micromonospora andamanensis]
MAQFIYVLDKARKAHGDKVVLDNVTLNFLPGAKIGVVGPNGAGKSSLLKIMAGWDQPSNGEARLMPGFTVGMLAQEPPLNDAKTVLGNVEEAVAETKVKLERFNKIAEQMATDYSDELMEEMGRLQEELDHADAWDIDSKLELAMDALRCPPPEADVTQLSGVSAAGSRCASCCWRPRTCCCSTSPRTTWTRRACSGWSSTWPSTPAPSSPSPTTGTSWTTWPTGSWSWTAAGPTRTRATTPPTWRRRPPGWPSRVAATPR